MRTAVLLAGDVAVLVSFAVIGRRTHDEAAGLAALREVLTTAAPFVSAWLLASIPLGAARRAATASVRAMLVRTAVAWLAAFPVAVALRGLMLARLSPWTFYAVAFTVALLMLLGWRLLFSLFERGRGTEPAPAHR